jgi:hypothetical protein
MFSLRFSKFFAVSALAAASTVPSIASAAPRVTPPGFHHTIPFRAERQQDRIQQGVRSGQLTFSEFRRDEARLHAIHQQRMAYLRRNDGHLTAGERARLQRELNRNSQRIWFTKHNLPDQPGI